MFHPVGSQPPTVYWRRRLLVLGTIVIVIVLLAVTISALSSGSSGAPSGQGSNSVAPPAGTSSSPDPSRTSRPASSPDPGSSSPTSPSGSATSSAVPATCRKADLDIQAVVGQSTYKIGAKPTVELRVTNVGSAPCVQDLADKQVVLKVYNGESRVWGSHDCETQPGTMLRTLAVGAPVQVSVDWSGTTSQPHCAGRRQQVGAGTYTLYATLSGKTGKAAQFTIS